jgi:hypothetical protein
VIASWRSRLAAAALASAAIACGTPPPAAPPAAATVMLAAPPPRPNLVYVSVASDATFHKVVVAALAEPATARFVSGLTCERVYYSGERGICLTTALDGATVSWWAELFDSQFARGARVPLSGEPSRVRVSPDGRLAAATVFEEGHSYADHTFSTRTSLTTLPEGTSLGDLEQFDTVRDGRPFKAVDFNFWGLTFAADSDTFYATLDTGGVSYLVKGSITARRMAVVRGGVECPSLSPDNTRVAFKRRIGARSQGWWQIGVLELATMKETLVTAETRTVDDQVEWLDNERVTYHLTGGSNAADLWAVRVDNSSKPELLVPAAFSPAVIR